MASDAIAIWRAVYLHGAAMYPAKSTFHSTDPRHVGVHHYQPIGHVVSLLHIGGVFDIVPSKMTLCWETSTTLKPKTASSLHLTIWQMKKRGVEGKDEVISIPFRNQSFLTHCSAFIAPDCILCLHVGHRPNSMLEGPREGLK